MAKNDPGTEEGKDGNVRQALEGLGQSAGDGPAGGTFTQPADPMGAEDVPFFSRGINILGPNNLDRAVFCRQLSTMIEVGITLLKSLRLLATRTPHRKLAAAVADVADKVEEGQSVAQAMEAHERVFSPIVCKIVRVGEVGGIMEGSLVRLADIMESKAEINRKVRSALMYPAVALLVAVAVVVLILVKAVPVFTGVYSRADAELPLPTRIVVSLSEALINYSWLWIIIIIAVIGGLTLFRRSPAGHRVFSFIALRFPIIGRITQKIGVARFSRTLGGLVTAGIPLVEAVSIAADTNENSVISDALNHVQRSVEKGEKMSPPLARTRIFPPLVVDMIAIGEETGTLDRMLDRIADIYDGQVDSTLQGLSTIIEPILIVFLGGIVIFIALAVMLPYFNLVDIV